jgi:adenine/guanine/hypoxanthine permease
VLGAITAFIIDKEFVSAAVYCFIGAVLGFIGLIHGEQVGWNVGGQIALGYAFAGIVLLGFAFVTRGGTKAAPADEESAPEKAVEVRDEPATVAPIDTTRPATA